MGGAVVVVECVEDLRLVYWEDRRGAVRTNATVIVGAKMLI